MAKKLIDGGNATFIEEYEKKHDALSEGGFGHWRMQEEQFGARQEKSDKANEATINSYTLAKIAIILAVASFVISLASFLLYSKVI